MKFLVTGGAGFIGSNFVARLLTRGEDVTVYDSLARRGSEANLRWLEDTFGKSSFRFVRGDIRDADAVAQVMADKDVVLHTAGQVAVTTSVNNPREDFEINAGGTLNVLEGARKAKNPPFVIFTSTNKVYGELTFLECHEAETRYELCGLPNGVSESQPLDFHSPYGCSKGAADQYVRDYSRIYGFPTVVFRMSCIYGQRQFGVEDQGWVAWFIICSVLNRGVTIYGDGKQVRDLLYVEDLLNAFEKAVERRNEIGGNIFNIGGGSQNAISIWAELGPLLEQTAGKKLDVAWADWRPGDQKIYVSDISKAKHELGWKPAIDVKTGVQKLYAWVTENKNLFG